MPWLAILGFVKRFWMPIGVALLFGAGMIWLHSRDSNNREIGATVQREADLRETLERTEKANEARDAIDRDVGTARYDQCLRTARTPANCERFLPVIQTPVR